MSKPVVIARFKGNGRDVMVTRMYIPSSDVTFLSVYNHGYLIATKVDRGQIGTAAAMRLLDEDRVYA